MKFKELLKQINQFEKEGIDVTFYKRVAEAINLLDEQLSEDKKLFNYLIENQLVNKKGEEEIRKLLIMQIGDFK